MDADRFPFQSKNRSYDTKKEKGMIRPVTLAYMMVQVSVYKWPQISTLGLNKLIVWNQI